MKIYWSLASIPELSTFSSAEQRRIWRKCLRRAMRNRRFWLAGVLPSLGLFLINVMALVFLMIRRAPLPYFTFACILTILIWSVISLFTRHFVVGIIIPYLREELPEFCSSCGYNLTCNVSGVCPECGMETKRRPTSTGIST